MIRFIGVVNGCESATSTRPASGGSARSERWIGNWPSGSCLGRPTAEPLETSAEKLNAEARTATSVSRTRREIMGFCQDRGIDSLGGITAEHAAAYLKSQRKAGRPPGLVSTAS